MIFRATVKTQYLLTILAVRQKEAQQEQSFKVIEVVRHEQELSSSINQKVPADIIQEIGVPLDYLTYETGY